MLSLEDFLDCIEIKIPSAEDFEDESEEDTLSLKFEEELVDKANPLMDHPNHNSHNPNHNPNPNPNPSGTASSASGSFFKNTMASDINQAIDLVQKFNSENQKYLKVCTDNWNQESILKLHSNLKGLKEVYILDDKIKDLKKRLSSRKERSDERERNRSSALIQSI